MTGLTPRLFVAVPLPAAQKKLLDSWGRERKREWPFGRWVFREDYHITLQFLGNCSEEQIKKMIPALHKLAAEQAVFSLAVQGLGTFGRPEQPRILWAGVGGELELLHQLQQQVVQSLAPIGFLPDDRPYRPHITLARKYQKNHFPLQSLQQLQLWKTGDTTWKVKEIVLYETRLGRQPMYHALERFPFKK
ncbi:RNA 2',3'-cyclic phosphodiesterase [Paenactinomyces guangxiensis]|nr:RNA 2',3'-cyclic phosphodiesterase [Paenactinomyces guangxiensis]